MENTIFESFLSKLSLSAKSIMEYNFYWNSYQTADKTSVWGKFSF